MRTVIVFILYEIHERIHISWSFT